MTALRILHESSGQARPAELLRALAREVRGDVRDDAISRGIHATDASHYQIVPSGVVWPRDAEDVVTTLRLAHEFGVPVTARGAGTSLSGQTHGPGLVLDLSRHLDGILEIDPKRRIARVQPGLILAQLNSRLAEHGLMFAPDPATATRATLAGMIGNNSSGTRSVRWGKTSDHVVALKVALADGTVLELERGNVEGWAAKCALSGREGEIYRGVDAIVEAHAEHIRLRYPKVMRRVAGYALDALLPERSRRSLTDLVVGSEGTLAVTLEATVRLVSKPTATAVCVVHFDDVVESLRHVRRMLEFRPLAVEMLDDVILSEARRNAATQHHAGFFVGEPRAIQIVELEGETPAEAEDKARELAAALEREGIGTAWPIVTDDVAKQGVWETRRLGLGLISNVKGPRKGQAFIEDASLPLEHLANYIEQVLEVCERESTPVSIYGHSSVGVLHARPMLDLHQQGEVDKMKRISNFCFELVREYGGCWSGEHGDGLVRGEFLERFYGPEITGAFRQIKELFDPQRQLNPGKVVDPEPMTSHLRYQVAGYEDAVEQAERQAGFHYRQQGGFGQAVEQCNGVGACRKVGAGIMCPSYMALRDEAHSTRGRANALRLAMSGQLGGVESALASDELHEVLDLCLACKACKSECPNAVDMARLKADCLQMRYRQRGVPLKSRLIGALPELAGMVAGPLAHVVNPIQRSGLFRATIQRWIGLDPSRRLPAFARRSLDRELQLAEESRAAPRPPLDSEAQLRKVVLYADTYTRFYEPEVGTAAVELLGQLGYEVQVAQVGDSQRPRLSQGLLGAAAKRGLVVLERLAELGDEQVPILCLEPSCASALVDDLPDLLDESESAAQVISRLKLLDDFLLEQPGRLQARSPTLFWHRHCHERSVFGLQVPEQIGDATVIDSRAGCCGMAGSFGYEHGELSTAVAEDRLLPNLRSALEQHGADLTVVANGFSCRHQLRDLLESELASVGVRVLHLSQAVSAAL